MLATLKGAGWVPVHCNTAGQADIGEIGGHRNADQRILLLHGSFRGGDVGTPLEQRRRNADRNSGDGAGEQIGSDRKFGRRAADQDGDGMFELRALHQRIERLRFGGEDLRLGRCHVALGDREAGLELIAHDVERLLVFGRVANEQIVQRIRRAQIEIGGGELRLRRKLDVVEVGGADLRDGGVALDLPRAPCPRRRESQAPVKPGTKVVVWRPGRRSITPAAPVAGPLYDRVPL